jgi:hypothetical protein
VKKLTYRVRIFFFFALAAGCGGHRDLHNAATGDAAIVGDSAVRAGGSTIQDTTTLSGKRMHGVQQEGGGKADSVSFLRNCADWQETAFGALMGLADRGGDSTANICFYSYYGQPETYEILFLYKEG